MKQNHQSWKMNQSCRWKCSFRSHYDVEFSLCVMKITKHTCSASLYTERVQLTYSILTPTRNRSYCITDIQTIVIWLVELTSRDIHLYSHPHRRSKRPIRPWGIAFPTQQLGSSLFPMFLSSTAAPLLKQRSTWKIWLLVVSNLCDFS